MASSTPTGKRFANGDKRFANGYLFGAPLRDLGWFASLIMGLASGMIAFFASTFCGIVFILFWNAAGHHADYTISYRLIGFPLGLVVGLLALAYLGSFWVRRIAKVPRVRNETSNLDRSKPAERMSSEKIQ